MQVSENADRDRAHFERQHPDMNEKGRRTARCDGSANGVSVTQTARSS